MIKTKLLPTVALISVLALFAFGCSSDDGGNVVETGSAGTTPTETPTTAATADHEEGADTNVDSHDDDDAANHVDDEAPEHHEQQDEAAEPETGHVEDEHAEVDGGHDDEMAMADGDGGTVSVVMNEFGYVIDQLEFAVGSTVTFEFINDGAIEHEAMFGTAHQQEEFHGDADHGGAGHHGDVTAITLAAGESGTLTVTFTEAGEVIIGCHLPGHWEAGMLTTVTVA